MKGICRSATRITRLSTGGRKEKNMVGFTLREPPEESGNAEKDIKEMFLWARELYDSLWLVEFAAVQAKKNKKDKEEETQ